MAKKANTEPHKHKDCQLADLMQWGDDPLIAQCQVNGEKHVASTVVACPLFKPRQTEPTVEHKEKRYGLVTK